jgi:hypothetical protein
MRDRWIENASGPRAASVSARSRSATTLGAVMMSSYDVITLVFQFLDFPLNVALQITTLLLFMVE